MSEDIAEDIRSLAIGVRAVVGGFTIMLSIFNIRAAFLIRYFQQVFQDALPGKPLSSLTLFIIWARTPLIALAIVLPLMALLILFVVRSNKTALIVSTVIMVAVFVQMNLTVSNLMAPMTDLFTGMSDQPAAR
jgi:hypothetical protein